MTSVVSVPRETNEIVLDGRRVCIVDDDALCRAQIGYLLSQKNMTVYEAADTMGLQSVLDDEMPDCLLVDYDLVSENGLFVIERLRQRYSRLPPIIMVSSDETQKTTIKAFRVGVSDFIPKRGMRLDDLSASIRRAIGDRTRELARELELERLRRNAQLDELTGFFTRDGFRERLALAVDSARRKNSRLALVALQIGHLSDVQDRFSVASTDKVVRAFAQRVRSLNTGADFIGAWRRGTFVLAFPPDLPSRVVSGIVDTLLDQAILEFDLTAVHLSLGALASVVTFPSDGADLDALLASLDEGLDAEARQLAGEAATSATDWIRLPAEDSGSGRDRRRETRVRTLKRGLIRIDGFGSLIDCTIRNQSPGGACLRLMVPMAIPDLFHLRFSETGEVRRVRKCWHVNNDLGVQYVSE